jgi:type IV pilus assembly protein PilZ
VLLAPRGLVWLLRAGYAFVVFSESERRTGGRTPIELKVSYRRKNAFFADYAKNISRGGSFIGTDKPLDVGTEFIFALEVPDLPEPLKLRGRVIWTTVPDEATRANPAGMGIEFQYHSDAERREIEARVEKLLAAELGEDLASGLLGRKPHSSVKGR